MNTLCGLRVTQFEGLLKRIVCHIVIALGLRVTQFEGLLKPIRSNLRQSILRVYSNESILRYSNLSRFFRWFTQT